MKTSLILALGLLVSAPPAIAADPEIARIVDEGLNRSHLMQNAHELIDGIGARLVNSPGMRRAEQWAVDKFQSYGLSDVRKEGAEFGRGWELLDIEVDMLTPRPLELKATSLTWSPGTDGPVEAEIFVAPMEGAADFDAYRGKLAGKFVLVDLPGTGDIPTQVPFRRFSDEDLAGLDRYSFPTYTHVEYEDMLNYRSRVLQIDEFLAAEGALGAIKKSPRDNKILSGAGGGYSRDRARTVPWIEMASEDYRRLTRLAKMGDAPRLRIDSQVRWHDEDVMSYSVIADIEGSDPSAGYVMAGAHLDSWAAGDGAVDNGAGVVTVIEAARILKTLGLRPRRTIRFALWTGEEEGLYGSKAYIDNHLARVPVPKDTPVRLRLGTFFYSHPIEKRPGYDDLKLYLNTDSGSGRYRGIYAENNLGAKPLLMKWLSAFQGMDVARVPMLPKNGTDHVIFQHIGLPAFAFVQDPLDYYSRLHHSSLDTFDHLQFEDMRQNAVILAGMLWQAANSEETIPPEPLPRKPDDTDIFGYQYPPSQ